MKPPISQTPDSRLLFWRMTQAMGIPLADAIQHDEMSPKLISRMLVKCAHCPQPDFCALYLAARDSHADSPPNFCANRTQFGRLHAQHPSRA